MYCEHCGTKTEEAAQFCHGCGKQIIKGGEKVSSDAVAVNLIVDDIFYSEEWQVRQSLGLLSSSHFDILLDKKDMYVIKLPSYNWGALGFVIGLFVLSILGAAIGAAIGGSHNAKKRKWYRSAWVDSNGKVFSHAYKQDIYMTIPLESLKKGIVYYKNRFTFIYKDKKITLQRSEKQVVRLKQYIEAYVL